jgi:hypothetical protein
MPYEKDSEKQEADEQRKYLFPPIFANFFIRVD